MREPGSVHKLGHADTFEPALMEELRRGGHDAALIRFGLSFADFHAEPLHGLTR